MNKYRYICIIVDSCTRQRWSLFLKRKSDSYAAIARWAENMLAKNNLKVGTFRSDCGGEFDNKEFEVWCDKHGYTVEPTAPYTPSQNGVVERFNRTLAEAVRSILKQHNLPKNWWDFAAEHATNVLNMMPSNTLNNKPLITHGVVQYQMYLT